jgi:hypothetical protein
VNRSMPTLGPGAIIALALVMRPVCGLAGDANLFSGGRTTIGGQQNLDLQRNSRVGATFSTALDRHQAIRRSISRGAYTTVGAEFTSIAFGYNYTWTR